MKFEERIIKLEEIANKLDSADTTLEESIQLYETSLKEAKECLKILNSNKDKMKDLIKEMDMVFSGESNEL